MSVLNVKVQDSVLEFDYYIQGYLRCLPQRKKVFAISAYVHLHKSCSRAKTRHSSIPLLPFRLIKELKRVLLRIGYTISICSVK